MRADAPIAARELAWAPLPAAPRLDVGAIHLIAGVVPESHRTGEEDWLLLNAAENERAKRLRLDDHRHRWVAARAQLKRLLAVYAGCDSDEVGLGFGELGKPYLKRPHGTGVRFNYTDSGGSLIYAFARDIEVGIDLEILPRRTNYARLAARKLSPAERGVFGRLPKEHRELAFLASWTRKEAYGKAIGVGIRYPMHEVTVCEDYGLSNHTVTGADGVTHRLEQVRPPFPGIACIAANETRFVLEGYVVDPVP